MRNGIAKNLVLHSTPGFRVRRPGRLKAGRFLIAVVIFVATLIASLPSSANHGQSFSESRSFYVTGGAELDFQHLGCEVAQRDRRGYMTLFFGAPVDVGGSYGVTRFSGSDVVLSGTANGVSNSTKNFVIGYNSCASGSDFIIIGIGTSNCNLGGASADCTTGSGPTSTWVRGHGAAFAQMVNGVGSWITQNGYGGRAQVRGAWDMEPSWSSTSKADSWMHGYDFDGPNSYALLANYSADGCPQTRVYNSSANGTCNNGFTQSWMFHLTEGHTTLEFPQIYTSATAIQWMRIEEYANHAAGSSLYFLGAMGGEGVPNNTAHLAHQALWTELNQPTPSGAHSPNHAAQTIPNATLQFALTHGLHDH